VERRKKKKEGGEKRFFKKEGGGKLGEGGEENELSIAFSRSNPFTLWGTYMAGKKEKGKRRGEAPPWEREEGGGKEWGDIVALHIPEKEEKKKRRGGEEDTIGKGGRW